MGRLSRIIAFSFIALAYVACALPVRQGGPSEIPIPDPVQSIPPTAVPPTTVPPATVPPTTLPPATVPPTTVSPTTVSPTTLPPTTTLPTTSSPTTPSISPSSTPLAPGPTISGAPVPLPTVTAVSTPESDPFESPESEPSSEPEEGSGLSGGAIAGIVIAAVAAFLLCLLCILCLFCFRKRDSKSDEDQKPAVYSSSDAAATPPPPPPPAVVPPPPPFSKDEARQLGPSPGVGSEDPTVVPPPVVNPVGDAGDPLLRSSALGPVVAPVARGPTPPPHDYVLGAGPAATRSDFDDLHARFEREEIGDNSAVLGVDRSGQAPPSIMGPERNYDNEGVVAEGMEGRGLEPPPAFPTSGIDDQAGRGIDYGDNDILGAPGRTAGGENFPDRENLSVPPFETQEQMAGGDGSGAISNAPVNINNTTIAEEGGDVPSLERDPINYNRDQAV